MRSRNEVMTPEATGMMLTDRELQSLRNLGNEAEAAADVLAAVKDRLGLTDHDADTDAVAVIDMLKSWESDANRRADRLEKHLRNVLEIARTWQPDYATKMDRDTLQHAEDFADRKTPNAELTGRLRSG